MKHCVEVNADSSVFHFLPSCQTLAQSSKCVSVHSPHLWHLEIQSCRLVDTGTYSTDIIGYSPCFVMVDTALVQWRDYCRHCCFVLVEKSRGRFGWIFYKHMLLITINISHTSICIWMKSSSPGYTVPNLSFPPWVWHQWKMAALWIWSFNILINLQHTLATTDVHFAPWKSCLLRSPE